MNSSVMVTGGAGFIGHHLIRALLADPRIDVTIVDNMSNSNPNFALDRCRDVNFYKEDIRNKKGLTEIMKRQGIETCIHLGAKISVNDSIQNPFETLDVNVNGTTSVLAACAESNVGRIIFASSAAVYGETKTLPIVETHDLRPISPYGVSKLSAEWMVTAFKNAGKIPRAVILRFFNVYGSGQSREYAGVITRFAERLSKRLPPIIYGTGNQTRDFVSVSDIVSAVLLSIKMDVSGTFNIGTGLPITINELARQMIRLYGLTIDPEYRDLPEGDIPHSYADISEAQKKLGFVARAGLVESLQTMLMPSATGASVLSN